MYLVIKELAGIANDVIMITASLTKDINSKSDLVYRPNAIRALCRITDASMLAAIERFLKQVRFLFLIISLLSLLNLHILSFIISFSSFNHFSLSLSLSL